MNAVHVPDTIGNGPAERTSESRAAEEDGDSRCALFGPVPEAEEEDHAGKDTGLESAEEKAEGGDGGEGADAADTGADGPESNDENAKPAASPKVNNVSRAAKERG